LLLIERERKGIGEEFRISDFGFRISQIKQAAKAIRNSSLPSLLKAMVLSRSGAPNLLLPSKYTPTQSVARKHLPAAYLPPTWKRSGSNADYDKRRISDSSMPSCDKQFIYALLPL
jgi:hypothetical protein